MARSRNSNHHTGKADDAPASLLSPKELERALTLSVLRRVSTMLSMDTIQSFDTWAEDVATDLKMEKCIIQGLVEPQVLITIGKLFGLPEVRNLKIVFEAVTGMASEATRVAAQKIVTDTIKRLEKKK